MLSVTARSAERVENPAERRFRLYNVGMAKTGTTSIAAIFGRYRSAHEYKFEETVKQIAAWHDGLLSAERFRSYVLERDREGGLEVDSASFNHHFLDILVEQYPDAKFVFSVRDCFSWFSSIVNMGLQADGAIPEWMMEYGRFLARGAVESDSVSSRIDVVRVLPDLLDGLFLYWSETNARVLELLPAGRALIVRTGEISTSVDRLALFAGVPRDSLLARSSLRNRAPKRLDVLKSLDSRLVEERYRAHCRPLMKRLFPNFDPQRDLSW